MKKQHKFLRSALAVVLTCGLMVPTAAAYADDENAGSPPPSKF